MTTAFQTGSELVKIETQNVTSNVAQVDFVSSINSTYETYLFVIQNIQPDSGDGTGRQLQLRTSSNLGVSFDNGSSDYQYANLRYITSVVTQQTSTAASFVQLSPNINGGTTDGGHLQIYLFNPSQTTKNKVIYAKNTSIVNSGVNEITEVSGTRQSTAVVNGVRFLFSAGNINNGIFTLYGLR